MRLNLTVNGEPRTLEALPHSRLIDLLREELGLTSVKEGCGIGECGACTVLMNGVAVNACLVLSGQAEGASIETVEGLAQGDALHPLQRALIEQGAVQCGYCTPGMIMSSLALLRRSSNPSDAEIRLAIAGNLCRCTGYVQIVNAIKATIEACRTPAP